MAPSWVEKLTPSSPQGSELLQQERDQSNVPIEKLSEFLFTKEALDRQNRILNVLKSEKTFEKSANYFDGRVERFQTALARAKKLQQLTIKHKWSRDDFMVANELISEPGPYGLHASMFLITLRDQGTPEQHKLFLEKAEKYEYIGCYAQTELGHGSNVRGLETTATWDPTDKTFVIHSPHLTASKWWIGSLGRTANHAVVMAQLIIDGKGYGPHPFVVQIRDLKTHEPLENIHVGDIGPKFGYNTMDNGFLLLNHVKIPHVNMLAKFSSVDPKTNKYVRPASASLVYGTLTWVRSTIVLQSGGVLARGVTIATRYCAVRRQFQDRDAKEWETGENQVLNYTMVQIRLLPLLAATFALHFTGRGMMALYQENQKKMAGDVGKISSTKRGPSPEELFPATDLLADLHATSCGLKALASTTAAEGLEVCRRACGGHGYSSFSGIGSWYADYLPTTTWEGDNYMLTQQVARYLLKSARAVLHGKASDNDTSRIFKSFLARRDIGAAFDVLGRDEDIVAAFAWRTSFLTFEALKHRDEEKGSWNGLLVDFWRLSTAHSQYLVVKNFYEALRTNEITSALDPETVALMHKLFRLYALHTLEQEASEFFSSSAVTVRQIQLARTKAVMKLLEEIRPHAVKLVDAWHFPDWQLDSSLGRYDGKVYEDLFKRASELNPLNALTIDPYPDSNVLVKKDARQRFESLTITNPLVLYRALLATKQIDPDPAQHRLALHLQKLYRSLKDYEPEVDFSYRLEQLNRSFGNPSPTSTQAKYHENLPDNGKPQGIFSSFSRQKEKAEAMALTKKLTNHETAIRLQSPQGLLLYGEVGTGKSMLVDLLADCLPNRKKRRWHFNTFMLETFARLEQLRKSRLVTPALISTRGQEEEHSLLWLARDMISTSPILFLDEFQLPDRAASKILSNLFTSFFHLGGVLIATSNRMPEELANASGVEFTAPPSSRLGLFGNRWGLLGSGKGSEGGRSESMFSGKGDFAAFLEVLRARCEIWDIEGGKDWRRREAEEDSEKESSLDSISAAQDNERGFEGLEAMASGNLGLAYEQSLHAKAQDETLTNEGKISKNHLPKNFFVIPPLSLTDDEREQANRSWQKVLHQAVSHGEGLPNFPAAIEWESTSLQVFGRNLIVPRQRSGVTYWTFAELCSTNLGPADYITIASTFHTLILTEVPILTLLQKNEARRLITLLDALYEARCKLLIRAEAGPDDLFFPETQQSSNGDQKLNPTDDSVYSETFSEIYQDQISPFRPNISSYTSSASLPSYASSPLPSSPLQRTSSSPSTRSILADEDSDFGPVYGAGRSADSRFRGPSDGTPGAGNEIGRQEGPNFSHTGSFTGEDERFAYKRARSRLWEMCGKRWWDRQEEGWWRPVSKAVRRWEGHGPDQVAKHELAVGQLEATKEDPLKQTSPFRTSQEPPPKIGWVHAWGMMKWGKKAGAWGKGVEGLQEREKKGGKGEA